MHYTTDEKHLFKVREMCLMTVRCRHIDCSSQPDNEEEIGKAMSEIFGDWIVNRPDVFVTARLQETNPRKMVEAQEDILKRLQTEFVDLLLLPADHIKGIENLKARFKIPTLVLPSLQTTSTGENETG